MGIFNTYGLLPQSYKTLPSNVTFCMYWVCETQNLKIFTVSITDYLQNAYVYQLSGMKIVGVVTTFAIFVVQPLFYLNGDANFRNRVQTQGLWKALKKELFLNKLSNSNYIK